MELRISGNKFGGLQESNPGPLDRETTRLTTRPRQLVKFLYLGGDLDGDVSDLRERRVEAADGQVGVADDLGQAFGGRQEHLERHKSLFEGLVPLVLF